MAEKRRGLGRGLGALIPSGPVDEPEQRPESPAPRSGRPADLFFPAALDRPTQDGGDTADDMRSARAASGINKDALKASTRGSRRPTAKRVSSLAAGSDKPGGSHVGAVPDEPGSPGARKSEVQPGASGTVQQPAAEVEFSAGDSVAVETTAEVPAVEQPKAVKRVTDEYMTDQAAREDLGPALVEPTVREEAVSRETVIAATGTDLVEVPGATFAEIPIDLIHANRKQPRSVFDEDEMAELVNSIREIGVLQPIVVRPSTEGGNQPYELVMGERRWRATREAGLKVVPAIIRSTTDDDLLRDALLENLHRSQLNPLEEAAAYQQLLDDFGCSHDELASRIGRSRPQISNTLRLMKLPPLVQRRLAAGVISAGHARALLGLSDQVEMEKLAQKIVAEGLSVRTTEELVSMNDGLRRTVKPNTPRAGARHERLDYLATSLSDRLDTSVKITLGARKGKVSIEFASVDDLNRIMGVLGTGPAS